MNWFNETQTGYRYDKRLFIGVFCLIGALFFLVYWQNNFNTHPYFYLECEEERCLNPIMEKSFKCTNEVRFLFVLPIYQDKDCMANCQEEWCSQEYVSRGIYGKKAPRLMTWFGYIAFGLFFLCIVMNHLIHNKGKHFDLELTISKNKRYSVTKWIFEKNEENKDNGPE